ncbi:hypothetical protein L2E82_28406 [Cichorium intybus]|uniref:Uncharacterized protein n=1 Tax=Cichorium intybus TaxID=13427 RepID=A0ACB9CVQ1_CICIN|nr:hypothetical protein L2E82_28406 [Cichorium intybus]
MKRRNRNSFVRFSHINGHLWHALFYYSVGNSNRSRISDTSVPVMIRIWVNGVEGQKLEGQSATFSAKIPETSNGLTKQSVIVPNPSNCCTNLSSHVLSHI